MALQIFELPTSSTAQTYQVALGGVLYQVTFRWIDVAQYWIVDIGDSTGELIVGSLPLEPGYDLLGQYAYLGIGGSLVVANDASPDNPPDYASLGTLAHIYYVVAS